MEYEKKKDDSQEKKLVDRSHLEKKSFLEAMALLGGDDYNRSLLGSEWFQSTGSGMIRPKASMSKSPA